jgi:hypothetical protein
MSELITGNFPQARLDEMTKAAQEFDIRAYPKTDEAAYDLRKDTATTAYVARQLEYLRPGLFEVQYPNLKGKRWVPVNSSMPLGAEQFTITIMDKVGQVKHVKDFSKDLSRVEMSTSQKSMNVFSMGISYAWNINEIRAAMYANLPLQTKKAMTARDLMARKFDDILLDGETTTGVKGLFTLSGTETYTVTADGTGASKTFETKSADKIVRDLNGALGQIILNSLEVHVPNTVILPLSTYQYVGATRVGDGTSDTVLSYWLRTNPYGIGTAEYSTKLETAGSGSTKRIVTYEKNPNVLEMISPVEFEQFAPETFNTEVQTICHMRVGGVALYMPKAVCYSDGV